MPAKAIIGVGHSLRESRSTTRMEPKTAIHVVAQENRHDLVERPSFHIGLDALGHFVEQIVATVNIAHAIDPRPIRDATRGRNRG